MATIKSYTDLPQSKRLANILPIESADMVYIDVGYSSRLLPKDDIDANTYPVIVSCWSLAALLDVLPKIVNNETLFIATSAALWHIGYKNIYTAIDDNLIDACVELIEKLHELKML